MRGHGRSLILVGLLTAALAGCTDEPAEWELPSAPAPAASTAPAQPALGLGGARVVFIRGAGAAEFPARGSIWVSDLAGSNARQITPEGVAARFVRVIDAKSGARQLYYLSQDAEGNTSLYEADLDTGQTSVVLTYRDIPEHYYADVSPDGRYVVHTQPLGLDMYDLATGETVTLFRAGSGPDCQAGVIAECYRAIAPDWSPDGRLLIVVHSVYEGGWAEVVDPFRSPPAVLTAGDREYPSQASWSPAGDAACAYGQYADVSGLYLLEAPDWEARNLFPQFEDPTANPEGRSVVDCAWISRDRIAYLAVRQTPNNQGELYILDRRSETSRLVATLADATSCCTGNLTVLAGGRLAITQFFVLEGSASKWSRPFAVDLETGAGTPVLEEGDFLVAMFSP